MAQKMITIHLKNRKSVQIPENNLNNFKRIFYSQIDYIEEEEGLPIIAKPIFEEVVEEIDLTTLSKKELQDLAKDKKDYDASMSKAKLIELINK